MLPHLGQGANQAIEDGVALGVILEKRDSSEAPARLQRYEAFRRERTEMIQAEARTASVMIRGLGVLSSATARLQIQQRSVSTQVTKNLEER
jgi:2-polyprenyl-6-methoxyphenol hydroxylase-like FAD-dependent oxidoreductase